MIKIILNKADFEYDIYSLTQAFFPGEELYLFYDIPEDEKEDLPYQVKRRTELEKRDRPARLTLSVAFGKNEEDILLSLLDNEEKLIDKALVRPSDPEDRPEVKNALKKSLYGIFSSYSGKSLPWGTLTGIRPTKLMLKHLLSGMDEGSIMDLMKRDYLVSDHKIDLGLSVIKREEGIIKSLHTISGKGGGYSLYIGIPFCPTTCLYCSFPSYSIMGMKNMVEPYLEALKKEIRSSYEIMKDRILDTVYIGGGTPTSLSPEELDGLFSFMEEVLPMDGLSEFTVEAGRPDSITEEKLKVMKDHGVTRISVNPQTMNQKTLDLIGRHHTVSQLKECYGLARSMGFDNINMDLILGLPGETKEELLYTFEEIKKMKPDDLTVHSLAIKTHSRLHEEWAEYEKYAINNSSELMDIAYRAAYDMGLHPYYLYRQKQMAGNLENTGFARPGAEGLYNIMIMEEQEDIVACGAGTACKKVFADGHTERCEDVRDIGTYIERIDEMIGRKQVLFGHLKD